LHPLPVPEMQGDSVGLDCIGPLPLDEGFDCILTMTDRLGGADLRIVPTRVNIDAEELASLFFTHWYCENGLPLHIVSDRDKLFMSSFWRALNVLTGVRLKMSSAYHPETDGVSEHTNKTVNQAIRYHVQRNQKGWVRALPHIRFEIMNTVNASTGFSGFQLRMGRCPRIIPLLVPERLPTELTDVDSTERATALLEQIQMDCNEAKDNLLLAKTNQAFHANKSRGKDDIFAVGDRVMLSMLHRRREYRKKGERHAAKFFPRFDGPYKIIGVHSETSNYTLDLPNSNAFPTFHVSELKRFHENDPDLFPGRAHAQPGPVVGEEGLEEYAIEKIVDSRKHGRGWQFLVRWAGYGPEEDRWLSTSALDECEALNRWYESGGDGPAAAQ
jgi:hypothetical protein